MAIERVAQEGFQAGSAMYHKGRPHYAADVIEYLRNELPLRPGIHAAELGAGTGIFTRFLVQTGAQITAIEPVAGMREQFLSHLPHVPLLEATAEAMPLADASQDAVLAAQAFHWFATDAALREIRRVLKPGGCLALIWNVQDRSLRWIRDINEIIDRHKKGIPQYGDGGWQGVFTRSSAFGALEHRRFRHVERCDHAAILNRLLSISYVAALPQAEFAAVEKELKEFIQATPELRDHATVEYPYFCDVYLTRAK